MSFRLNMPVSDEANELLSNNAFALLIALVLDQQVPLERAFSAPLEVQRRLGKPYDVVSIASMRSDKLEKIFATPPALHRFPVANAKRVQALAYLIIDEYAGDAANIWNSVKSGEELLERVNELPGFGERKAQIFVALLGKQMGITPRGWRHACAPFGEKKSTMSIADITDDASLQEVRAWKRAQKDVKK